MRGLGEIFGMTLLGVLVSVEMLGEELGGLAGFFLSSFCNLFTCIYSLCILEYKIHLLFLFSALLLVLHYILWDMAAGKYWFSTSRLSAIQNSACHFKK